MDFAQNKSGIQSLHFFVALHEVEITGFKHLEDIARFFESRVF